MWRKNRVKFDDTTYGVDVNRNYGNYAFWDAPNSGSSTDPQSDTYRGTAPFSELETQAIRDFCYKHNFKVCLNYHTFGNLFIYPWGALSCETPDSSLFRAWGTEMGTKTFLSIGIDWETVGYSTRGGTDDWMYLQDSTKDKILSVTPEIGNDLDGFWPIKDRIIPIAQEHLPMNYQLVWSAGANLRPRSCKVEVDTSTNKVYLNVNIQNIGAMDENIMSGLTINPLDGPY